MLIRPQSYSPEDCDKVLAEFENKETIDSFITSMALDVTPEFLSPMLQSLASLNPVYIGWNIVAGSFYQIYIHSGKEGAILDFIRSGGFTQREKEAAKQAERDQRRLELEMENLELTIRRAKEAKKEARLALWIAAIAAAASLLAIFL